MMNVDILQVLINSSAVVGIGLFWFGFNEKVFKTVRRLAAAPFYLLKKKDDSSSDCNDANVEELHCCDVKDVDCSDDSREPQLLIDLRVSSPFFDEADMERLERKGFKKVLLEILNATLIDKDAEKKTD